MRYVTALLVASLSAPTLAFDGWLKASYADGFNGDPAYERALGGHLRHSDEWQGWRLQAEGRYRWNPGACNYGDASCSAYRSTADWRELYLARDFADWTLSAGWQQVVWGRADNLRVFDLVNPLDLRDYVLPDLNDYRIAVPMLRSNAMLGDWQMDLLYLPWFEGNDYAASGSPYDLAIDQQFAAAGLALAAADKPGRSFNHGELGVEFATSLGAVDWSLMAFSTYNDDPVYRYDFSQEQPAMVPSYLRYQLLGVGNAIALDGGWVARSELTWSPNTPYSRLSSADGTSRNATLTALLGLDYSWRDWLLTGQLSDRYIDGWQSDFLSPEHQAFITLSASGNQLSDRLSTRLALTLMPQNGDGLWWQWRSIYRLSDDWQLETSLDLLNGQPYGFFGQFSDRDRLRFELRRYF